jgi:hypothetical protein
VILACGGSGSDGPPKGGGGTGGTGGISMSCETLDPKPEGCDDLCPSGSDSECTLGTHCLNGTCEAHCTATQGCAEGASCNVRGRCVGGTGGSGGTGNTGGGTCRDIEVTPSRSIPNVMFLVDRSGSMLFELDGTNPARPDEPKRWEIAHDAIEAVITETQSIVSFGLATYHWNDNEYTLNNSPPDPECPIVGPAGGSVQSFVPVGFALNNADTILASYPATFPNDPQGDRNDTPTGESIDKLVAWVGDNRPQNEEPIIIVLATDGEPDSCQYPDSNGTLAKQMSVQAAKDAFGDPTDPNDLEVQTMVLSVGRDVSATHLQDMANVGVGLEEDGSEGNARFWVGTDTEGPNSLEAAFREIISDSISCEIEINKPFNPETVEEACAQGVVTLNDDRLSCPSDWLVKNEPPYNVIQLQGTEPGSACQVFKSGEVIFEAHFPCGTIIVE